MSTPLEQFAEAHERHESGHAPTWVPLAAAILAVLAAISGFVSNVRATSALVAKNDAIIATTHAADSWNEYEARSIKQHIYEAAVDAGTAHDSAKLRAVAKHEKSAGKPVMAKARAFEAEALRDGERSERLLGAHEILEVATTLFEVSIVLVSITALVGSRLLPVVAGVASAVGVVIFVVGLLRS